MQSVVEKLLFSSDFMTISLTSNRPNITYATWPITGSLNNFRNLQFLIPDTGNEPFDPQMIPKTLIFRDDREEAANAANSSIASALSPCARIALPNTITA